MLTIRNAQLEILRLARIEGFVDDMLAYMANEYPRHFAPLGLEQARAFVERSIEAAGQWGITTRGSIGALIELRLVYGEQLQRARDRQWALNLLAHPTLPDYIKVGAVQDRLSERAGGRLLVVHQEPS